MIRRLLAWAVALFLLPSVVSLVWIGWAWVAERRRTWRVSR